MAIFDTMQLAGATSPPTPWPPDGVIPARGRRIGGALPHARIMMHQPSAGIGGTAADIAIQAEQFAATKKRG